MDRDEVVAIGNAVKRLRKARGWTQQDLRDASRADLSSLQKLEQGKASAPSVDTLRKLAAALGVTIDHLLGGEGAAPMGIPEAYEHFLSTDKGQAATPEEAEALLHAALHPPRGRRVTVDYLSVVLTAMRGALTPDEAENAMDTAETIRRLDK